MDKNGEDTACIALRAISPRTEALPPDTLALGIEEELVKMLVNKGASAILVEENPLPRDLSKLPPPAKLQPYMNQAVKVAEACRVSFQLFVSVIWQDEPNLPSRGWLRQMAELLNGINKVHFFLAVPELLQEYYSFFGESTVRKLRVLRKTNSMPSSAESVL
ncbi:unnamed protein product [Calicophoron daubneyi]|uniref:Uncharacterized protein n=1 Tax=Calicophoron daubneyi TaxID=300641 RepID=A0AAV2T008_CALDB